jgi:hypothetical protein
MPLALPDPQLPADPKDALESIQRNFEALATDPPPSVTATATYENGAVSFSGGVVARKYADGKVVLSGGVNRSGGFSADTTYARLPAGFRPVAALRVAVAGFGGLSAVPINATINVSGTIQLPNPGDAETFLLDGITFHAA